MSTQPPVKEKKANPYKQSLNLPQTAFAMEAKLVTNEPVRLKKWQEGKLYEQTLAARANAEKWVLHDGPPFANGDIHIGHLLNKTLKDVAIRFRCMQGYQTPYVPGWDCHGLPIEQKIQDELGSKLREMSAVEVRKLCFDHASKYVGVQSEQFQRLGILGDWDNPYLTMKPTYEASTLEVFAKFVEAGLVYRKLKPVYWSIANQTALAEADIEYKDVEGPSIYVEFPAVPSDALSTLLGDKGDVGDKGDGSPYFLVWTTTPWTLPANLAIAVHPEIEYSIVKYARNGAERIGIVARQLAEKVLKEKGGVTSLETLKTVSGQQLVDAKLQYNHPFIDRTGPILPADYVTTTDGTGLVHTAPGHGADDYLTGLSHGLEVYSPVLHNGLYDDTVPAFLRGISVWKADPIIIKHLEDNGLMLHSGRHLHSYPHDERSKTPIIFRATEQWFIGVDQEFAAPGEIGLRPRSLRQRALDAANKEIEFIPAWGRARITGMLQSRPDWTISRQRAWGLPIPVFYNGQGQPLLTPASVRAVARTFATKGSDAWFTDSPKELLGPDFEYPAGFVADDLRKEKDIFDVWFESGSSWNGVLRAREDALKFPADLYLEGSDQHRGWFQLSMLPALGATGVPPFRQVLTHGFIVGPDGKKKSKRDKDYVTATQEINQHGADLLRLWCCSNDYQGDVTASPQLIKEFGDKYRKIRNTLRYLLSNLYDYASDASIEVPQRSLDGWMLHQLDELIRETTAAYDAFHFHRAFRLLHDFCSVQISSIYGNAMKDRLYCEKPDSPIRRRSQRVMHQLVLALTKLLAPMLVFTADEAWEHIPHKPTDDAQLSSVHLATLPVASDRTITDEQLEEWRVLMELREQALLQLDALKKDAGLNKALDAELVYRVDDDDLRRRLQDYGPDLEDIVGAGFHSLAEKSTEGPAVQVSVIDRRETYKACARSWKRRPDVGSVAEFPELSARDAAAFFAPTSPSPGSGGDR